MGASGNIRKKPNLFKSMTFLIPVDTGVLLFDKKI